DRLRRQRSDAMVFPQSERVPGFGEMALRFLDIPAALFRVSHASLGLFDDSLEDSFPSLVERSDGDSTKQAFRGDEVPPGRDRPFRDVGRRPGRQAAVERLPADVARGTPVRYVRFAEGAAGHVAPTEGSPSTSGGNDTVGCRVCRYK